jgi:hypothetical protein
MKIFPLSALLITTSVLAWGPTGHRTVAEVAERNLTPKTLEAVKKILKGNNLARAATFPDEIRSDPKKYSYTFVWHFTDWPDDMQEHDENKGDGRLIQTLPELLKTIKNPSASADEKEFALKFIIHMVGDIHQPLHVGTGHDRGGNDCKVTFHDEPMNLHELWDDAMIDFNRLSYTELATFVLNGRSEKDRAETMKGSPLDWALEGKQIRPSVYPENAKTYCQKEVPKEAIPKLSYEYSYKFMPILEKRLYQGGLRLAYLLNQAFDK